MVRFNTLTKNYILITDDRISFAYAKFFPIKLVSDVTSTVDQPRKERGRLVQRDGEI